MTQASVNAVVGHILEPDDFVPDKGRRIWRRERDGFLDEVSLQLSPKLDELTINFDIRHEVSRARIHAVAGVGRSGGYFSLSRRIGELAEGRGRWWARSDLSAPTQVASLICSEVLPFFSRMHQGEPYITELSQVFGLERWTLVTPRLELAVMLHDRGDRERALALLDNPHPRFGAPELKRVAAVRRLLSDEASALPGTRRVAP